MQFKFQANRKHTSTSNRIIKHSQNIVKFSVSAKDIFSINLNSCQNLYKDCNQMLFVKFTQYIHAKYDGVISFIESKQDFSENRFQKI